MAFDREKAQFNQEELDMAQAADFLYETFRTALEDGLDFQDLSVIPAAVPQIMALYGYLAGGTKAEYATKLIALGVALLRDNEFLAGLDAQPE